MSSAAQSRIGIALVGAGFASLFIFRQRVAGSMLFAGGWPAGRSTVAVIAAAFAIAGGLFTVWAIRTLGKQWSFSARVVEGHRLVTHGPYAVVRNPIYASLALWMIAMCLAFATPLRLAISLALYVIGTLMRIRAEEELMRATFGEQWEAYRRRVPALIPFPRRG